MGRGPEHLFGNGLADALGSGGCRTRAVRVEAESSFRAEVSTAFEIARAISQRVRANSEAGDFPLVISGNCNSSLGTIAGAGPGGLGIVWFDGHADFNTPETTTTGFFDGMGLATAVGHCWSAMAAKVPGFAPIPESNVVLVGSREIEPAERRRLSASNVAVVGADLLRERGLQKTLGVTLDALKSRVERVYVHLDLDVLDPELVAPANEFAPAESLTVEEIEEGIREVQARFALAAAGMASYDPTCDPAGGVLHTGIRLARNLVRSQSPA